MIILEDVEMYDYKDVADKLNVSVQTIRNYARKGVFKPTLIGKKKYISKGQFLRFLDGTN